jgi:hypothetical protein
VQVAIPSDAQLTSQGSLPPHVIVHVADSSQATVQPPPEQFNAHVAISSHASSHPPPAHSKSHCPC